MRIFVVENGHDVDPCFVFAYGAVKQFSIRILSQLDTPCLPPASYCKTGNALVGDSNLGSVHLVGVQGTVIDDNSNCPNQEGPIDLTGLSASIQPGGSYVVSLQATTCGLGWARLAYAYIDFNGNSEFDTSELVGKFVVPNSITPVPIDFAFDVPCVGSGAVVGSVRLRVFVVEGDESLTPNPCALFNYGAVKEFTVQILNKPVKLCTVPDILH
jgi:hypothetical protein